MVPTYPNYWSQAPVNYYTTSYAAENYRLIFDVNGNMYRLNIGSGETHRYSIVLNSWVRIKEEEENDNEEGNPEG